MERAIAALLAVLAGGAVSGAERIDEAFFAEIHGVEQWVTLRGDDAGNPVLLVVSGPGAALSSMAPMFGPWERSFTLAQWDQPGAGATQAKNGDAGTDPITFARIARDGIAVAELVRAKLGTEKVALLALSGGTVSGLEMVKARPDLFSAYVGSGQVVSWSRQQKASYELLLHRLRAGDDAAALSELEGIGPPPWADTATDAIHSKYAGALTPAEENVFASLDPSVMAAIRSPPEDARYVARGLPRLDPRAQAMKTYDRLRSELLAFDARTLGLDFRVPMFFVQGEDDVYTVTSQVAVYEAEIRAPAKGLVRIEGGGHSAFFLVETFLAELVRHVPR